MAKIFLSYARDDRIYIDVLVPHIRRVYGNDNLWFDDDIHGGNDWWQLILSQIADCEVFLYAISNDSLKSSYCQAELQEAIRLQKQILPVIVRPKTSYPGSDIDSGLAQLLQKIHYVDVSKGIKDTDSITRLVASINQMLYEVKPREPLLLETTPEPLIDDKPKGKPSHPIKIWLIAIPVILLVLMVVFLIIWMQLQKDSEVRNLLFVSGSIDFRDRYCNGSCEGTKQVLDTLEVPLGTRISFVCRTSETDLWYQAYLTNEPSLSGYMYFTEANFLDENDKIYQIDETNNDEGLGLQICEDIAIEREDLVSTATSLASTIEAIQLTVNALATVSYQATPNTTLDSVANLPLLAETTGTLCDTADVGQLLAQINEIRHVNNLLPLAFNPILCRVAEDHAFDLASRPIGNVGNLNIRENDANNYLDVWLQDAGYQAYPDGFLAEMRPFVVADIPPQTTNTIPGVIQFLNNRGDSDSFTSYALSTNFREIGIAYIQTQSRYNYVFIFGSQPNIFPIIPISANYNFQSSDPIQYAYRTSLLEINLLIPNELYTPTGDYPIERIGIITHVRQMAHVEDIVACPNPSEPISNGWVRMPSTNIQAYSGNLLPQLGLQTLYFQMCDATRISTVSSININILRD